MIIFVILLFCLQSCHGTFLVSEKFLSALEQVKTLEVITFGHIVDHIEGEATLILCLISILPFMQPIPIPGVSSLLGFIVLLQGIGLLFWGKPILTKGIREAKISKEKFHQIYKTAQKFHQITSKISVFKSSIISTRMSHIFCGISIIISSAFLSLPLPIPFSNFIPALSIFLICLGLLEEDLLLYFIGHGITAVVIWISFFSYHLILEQFKIWF
jgi:hypothetical protein